MQQRDRYTLATEELITNPDLTGEELRMLLFLQCHDLPDSACGGARKGFVFVSRAKCSERLHRGYRRISTLFSSLERKGFIRREAQDGKVSRIVLLIPAPDLPLHKTVKGVADPCTKDSRVDQSTLDQNVQGRVDQNVQGTLDQNGQPEDKKEKKRKEDTLSFASASGNKTPKTVRKKYKSSCEKSSHHQQIVDHFHQSYLSRFGDQYVWQKADLKAVKELLKTIAPDDLKVRIDVFLSDEDPFVRKQGHSFRFFASRINAYRPETSGATAGKTPVPAAYRALE